MKEKIHTTPNLLNESPAHKAALAKGIDHFAAWTNNVADHFKSMTVSEIKEELRKTALPFAVCMENIIGDFNLGTVIRNANAFNAKEVFYIGNKKRDRRSEVGVYNYTNVNWIPTIEDFLSLKEKYYFIGVDNIIGSIPLSKYDYKFDRDIMFILGEEGVGLTPTMQLYCDDIVYIEQYGSVRSLNVGTASGIMFFDFARRIKLPI